MLVRELGADVNARTCYGETSLSIAAPHEVRILADEFGADIDTKDNEGGTPLHSALHCGLMTVAKCFSCLCGSLARRRTTEITMAIPFFILPRGVATKR